MSLIKKIKSSLVKKDPIKKPEPVKIEPEPIKKEMKHYKRYQAYYKTDDGKEFKKGMVVTCTSKKESLELLEYFYDTFYVEKIK